MAFIRPTLQQIADRIGADFVSKIAGAATLALRSVLLIMGKAYAGAVHLLYGYMDNQSKELFVATATGAQLGGRLDTHGSEYGLLRKAATPAVGTITFYGTQGKVIPKAASLVSSTGNHYTTDAQATIAASGSITTTVTCTAAGSAGNDNPGVTLTLETPITQVNSAAIVDASGLYGGIDDETDSDYRARVLKRKRTVSAGGTSGDLEDWALAVPAVTRAWAYPLYQGAGTVALYFVCDEQVPITPTAAQVAAVLAYLTTHANADGIDEGVPVTMLPGLFVAAPVLRVINFTIRLSPNTSTVQASVQTQLTDFLFQHGYPGQTLYLSNLTEAISSAGGVNHNAIATPAGDVVLAYNEVAQLGVITWVDY